MYVVDVDPGVAEGCGARLTEQDVAPGQIEVMPREVLPTPWRVAAPAAGVGAAAGGGASAGHGGLVVPVGRAALPVVVVGRCVPYLVYALIEALAGLCQPRKRGVTPHHVPSLPSLRSGPAGLFAALTAAAGGLPVVLLERGQAVEQRGKDIGRLLVRHQLDPESNLCYGEGGAGTWSDGKLATKIGAVVAVVGQRWWWRWRWSAARRRRQRPPPVSVGRKLRLRRVVVVHVHVRVQARTRSRCAACCRRWSTLARPP